MKGKTAWDTVRVLIVENEFLICHTLKESLLDMGVRHIDLAENRETAERFISFARPDLVLLDIQLGESENGFDVAAMLLNNGIDKFIFVTAHNDDQTKEQARQEFDAPLLSKPFRFHELRALIEQVLG